MNIDIAWLDHHNINSARPSGAIRCECASRCRRRGWDNNFPERQPDQTIKKFVGDVRAFIESYGEEGAKRPAAKGAWGGASNIERKAQVEQTAIQAVKNTARHTT